MTARSTAEIRADLADCDRDGLPWPSAARRLLADIEPLLARLEAVKALPELLLAALPTHLAYISRTVTASYREGMDPELVMRRRLGKVNVEAGEMWDAVEGWTGENPRKGVYAGREDVVRELIDCASASLCALEHMTGNKGDALGMLAAQVAGNAQRLSESIPDRNWGGEDLRPDGGPAKCSTCGEPMDTPGCSKRPGDERPRAVAGFHTIAGPGPVCDTAPEQSR